MEFKKYQHVERLGSPEVDGILNGNVYIFSKLDGTNTSVYLNDEGKIEVASRNRVLTPENDNQGAYAALHNDCRIRALLNLYPHWRLYGEWLVPHHFRNYIDDAWCKFYVFDVMDGDEYIPHLEYIRTLMGYYLDYIPAIDFLQNPTVEDVVAYKDSATFLTKDGVAGEGIVIKNYEFVNKYGRTTWAKVVRAESRVATKLQKPIIGRCIESEIVDAFVTEAFVEKEFYKLANENGGVFERKLIGRFLGVLWHTLITEETFNILRKFKNPKIDFQMLRRLTEEKVKIIKRDIFW